MLSFTIGKILILVLFFSIVVIILIILSIFIYIFLNNFEKEKIISDIEKKFEIKINGKITLETTNEEKFLITFLKLFFEKLENQKNQKFAFSELINAFGNESSNFKGAINKNKNILETSKIEISNKNNRILIKGEYNYSNNFINIILNLSQNNEIYLTTLIKGNLNNPNISFDENSKFFQNSNSNENNIIEESIIQFLNNFFDFND